MLENISENEPVSGLQRTALQRDIGELSLSSALGIEAVKMTLPTQAKYEHSNSEFWDVRNRFSVPS
jgi:hypothetical protein